ncbi:glycosyltransferase family 4 protein [Pseudomaricurvus alcaniphilus]|uniref:glycosyltransferase family 4 protein n=1 Tax=Pseudomaricurvus alcaniphilus TaxID=1166482 RepID=UPI001408CCF2|nr:glycosyltransferase family 4 protein [Pseudomaricurvus alcaniphilus]NHN36722.1 glycosyltransferase family 4 protein [Pseudomaricurvus alcaniphilus]
MKIAYIVQNYQAATELWLQRQIEILQEDIVFIAATDNKERFWNNRIPIVNLYSEYPFIKKLAIKLKILRKRTSRERNNEILLKKSRHKVDVLFINYLTMAYRLRDALSQIDVPIIIHTHGYDITWDLVSVDSGERMYDEEYLNFVREISSRALMVANSNESKKRLIALGVPDSRIVIKYFGVSLEINDIAAKDVNFVRILYIGRLVDCKAPDLVIQAFEQACDKGLRGELIIAGDGPLAITCRLLQKRSKYSDRIKLLGLVSAEDGRKLRKECDIFTAHNCRGPLTNQLEAFGVSIIEAMAAGLPVVTGRSGGVIDSVVDGETGFLFTPGDISEHADMLLQLALNAELRRSMGDKGRSRVKNKFSIELEKESLINLLKMTEGD